MIFELERLFQAGWIKRGCMTGRLLPLCLLAVLAAWSPQARADAEAVVRPFKVAYAASWAPFSVGEGEKVRGILPDLMEEIVGQAMGLPVEHNGLPWARAQVYVLRGDADGFVTTPTEQRLEYTVNSQETVLFVPFQAFVRKESAAADALASGASIASLRDFGFCDVLGNGWAKSFYEARRIEFLIVPTLDSCLKLLVKGKTDVIVHAAPVAQMFINRMQLAEAIELMPTVYPESPHFPLLLSKQSDYGVEFLHRFDETLAGMKASGTFDRLMREIVARHVKQE